MLSQKQVNKRALLGLLNWATAISHHLRSYTAPVYSDLRSLPGTLYSIPSRVWQRLLFSLDSKATVVKSPSGLRVPASSRVIEVGSIFVRRNRTCHVCLIQKGSRESALLTWQPQKPSLSRAKSPSLLSCVQATPTKPLSNPRFLQCLSAADAMAEGDKVGVGGWLCATDGLRWFS